MVMQEKINNSQFTRAYRSAGLWFVGMYMKMRLYELED